jgi:hypothetical protein
MKKPRSIKLGEGVVFTHAGVSYLVSPVNRNAICVSVQAAAMKLRPYSYGVLMIEADKLEDRPKDKRRMPSATRSRQG